MANNYRKMRSVLGAGLIMGMLWGSSALAVSYKKSTVVDFDGATVEGKSRKPYSAYVSEKAMEAPQELAQWQPDFKKEMQISRRKWEQSR